MCAPESAVYPLVAGVVHALLGGRHAAMAAAVAPLVWALLRGQSLHGADLARALPELSAAGARQAQRRVRRALGRVSLGSWSLTPGLLRAALRLVPEAEVTLVLDSTRCVRWELFTLGVVCHGRVLPVAWAVLPYPWPKGRFTPTVVDLLDRTLAAWPPDRPVHLVADRGFPSRPLFGCLDGWRARRPLGYTIRLRGTDYVRLADGAAVRVGDRARAAADGWRGWPASYQRRGPAAATAHLVVGRGTPSYPAHQRGPADAARRAARAARRLAHVRSKGQDPAADRVWALLSTHAAPADAVAAYARRFRTEGTYRDLKAWDLEPVAARATDAQHLDGLLGLASLGYLVQAAVGAAAGRTADPAARARQAQWSTTDRLSVCWRGRQVLHDRAHDWSGWLASALGELTHHLTPAPTRALPEAA
jgi:hypothetical protein